MTVEHSTPRVDPGRLAATARSVLACPLDVQLVVDGIDDVTDGIDPIDGDADGPGLALQDFDGRPVVDCPTDSALAAAAEDGRSALLRVTSGLGRPGSPDRAASLTLAGRLTTTGLEECTCCDQVRASVTIQLDYVLLTRTDGPDAAQHRVPLGAFTSPDHRLNQGFLQRSTEHANACHQDELRRAVSTTTDTRFGDVVGVHLTGLRPDRVEVQWVDGSGAHSRELVFGRPATTPAELGDLLREELHAGLC